MRRISRRTALFGGVCHGTNGALTVGMDQALVANGVEAELKKIGRVGRGKRDLILIAALVGLVGLIASIAVGFRGSDVGRSADAMTAPAPTPVWKTASGSTTR